MLAMVNAFILLKMLTMLTINGLENEVSFPIERRIISQLPIIL